MKKIIIIDDIKDVLEKESTFFDRTGVDVHPVPTNSEIPQAHRDINADLIVAYLDTPEMSVEELSLAVRKGDTRPDVPILVICPESTDCFDRLKDCNVDAFIKSSASVDSLLGHAHDLLDIPVRAGFRVPVKVSMSVTCEGINPFLGFSQDLSVGGMLLGTDRRINIGIRLACSFMLEEKEALKVEAVVVRVVGRMKKDVANFYGLEFIKMTPELAAEIEQFIQRTTV